MKEDLNTTDPLIRVNPDRIKLVGVKCVKGVQKGVRRLGAAFSASFSAFRNALKDESAETKHPKES